MFEVKSPWAENEEEVCEIDAMCAKGGDLVFQVAPSSPLSFFCLSYSRHWTLKQFNIKDKL